MCIRDSYQCECSLFRDPVFRAWFILGSWCCSSFASLFSNLLFLLLVGFCVEIFSVYCDVWFELLILFLVLCSWIWLSGLKVLLVCVSTLINVIGLCSVMLLVVLEFVLGSWWCSSFPSLCVYLALWFELLVVVLVPWCSLCVGSSLSLVFLVLCSPLPLLCPREPVSNLETYVLRAIREIWLQQIGRAIHRLDRARSVCVDAQPRLHPACSTNTIGRALPHLSSTPYIYTQPTAQDLQPIQLDDCHPPRQPPRRILSQLVANYGPCWSFNFPA